MGNSQAIFYPNSDYYISVHKKCQEMFDCRNCLSMIIRNIEGQCICKNIIQLNVEGDSYRIIHRDDKLMEKEVNP